jgi:hypothetical protein
MLKEIIDEDEAKELFETKMKKHMNNCKKGLDRFEIFGVEYKGTELLTKN